MHQYAYVILYAKGEKEDGTNLLYNEISRGYETIYKPLNVDADHPVTFKEQSPYIGDTLFSSYFSWLRRMIDLCSKDSDDLKKLKNVLKLDGDRTSDDVIKNIELDKALAEDATLKNFYEEVQNFKHEYGQMFILITSSDLPKELKHALANVAWNMVIDFDSQTREKGGLHYIISELWKDKRTILSTENIESDGERVTYWVDANGNATGSERSYADNDEEDGEWIDAYRDIIIDKINELFRQNTRGGNVILLDLFTHSFKPIMLYKGLPKGEKHIIRVIDCEANKIEGSHKKEIRADFKESVLNINSLCKLLYGLDNVITDSFGGSYFDISDKIANEYKGYNIEFIPIIPENRTTYENGISFYSGNIITWEELYTECDVKRKGYDAFYKRIVQRIIDGKNFTQNIVHKPYSGGTTVALRLGFDLMNKYETRYKCFVVYIKELFQTSDFISTLIPQHYNLTLFISS